MKQHINLNRLSLYDRP